ncbi:MAG TPA: DNA-directed RNA polymerase subunit beta' [Candidatus Cloacimonetes bacterium]|nr:DNA-directed RNA polymerase subunit beta' [Candidatus Cloacimonadota bacterium]HEX37870.1 DNA-directed RNA polymerase subunit beta' [Candidatus Cloacimonadota bacterium]
MIRELKRDKVVKDYDYVSIKIASPEKIRDWSYGEVTRPETINYRTLKPEKDGLFCERIFGPERDYECSCGKYKKYRFKGLICDRCGVEVTSSKVRRQRMGHIELAVPVAHIWFVKQIPSSIQLLLDLKSKELDRVLYYESYIVLNPGASDYNVGDVIDEESYMEAIEKYPTGFEADMGAEPIRYLLSQLDLNDEADKLRTAIKFETKQAKAKLIKKLKIVDAFLNSGNQPEWMILETIPVMPPDLRPLVYLEGGSFATADFNDLYRRVITRNNRLKALIEGHAPEVILRNEKRILQEAVDALLDNSRKSRPVKGRGNRPLKSLSDQLKGKKGRFRQNLLGKRVDYSGRSVIVIGPELKLNQCGLPKKMALELFKPFIIEKIEKIEGVSNSKQAKRLMEEKKPEVWKILEEVIKDYPVLLNRAPTLHRLSMQAFLPVLIEEKAIQLHPLLCFPFNADFDGDQMAVHIPLSGEAQMEARVLMTPVNNILSPANGKPVLMASQDIVLGVYFLTTAPTEEPEDLKGIPKFNSPEEVLLAYELKGTTVYQKYLDQGEDTGLHIHSWIELRCSKAKKRILTTVGRVIFNQIIPEDINYKNYSFDKGKINQLTYEVYAKHGAERTAYYLDDLKNLGFKYASKSGTTFGMVDVIVPKEKVNILSNAEEEVEEVQEEYETGIITESERYDRLIDQWKIATEEITDKMMEELKLDRHGFNPIWIMAVSGARGGRDQIKQLGAMRGLMEKPSRKLTGEMGEIIENHIKSNFKEGLSILEYFISTHGARKGLADTALKTADAGYLTRRLVDVAQTVVISTEDCGTMQGVEMTALKEGNKIIEPLSDRIKGRTAVEEVIDPVSGEIIVEAGETISDEKANLIQKHGVRNVRIRSVLTCEADKGICSKCYGRNLSTGKPVTIGEPVGVIAAQSIGEPGTQLTLRTFHIGGAASTMVEKAEVNADKDGVVKFEKLDYVINRDEQKIASSYQGKILIVDPETMEELSHYDVEYGATIFVSEDQRVVKDTLLFSWDNYNTPLISTEEGIVHYDDFIADETFKTEFNELTGRTEITILEAREAGKQAQLIIETDKKKKVRVPLPVGLNLEVEEGARVFPGEILGKTSRVTIKQRDITGGLPRVVELFEARSPSNKAVITEIDGIVKIGKLTRLGRKVTISSESTGIDKDYIIPYGRRIIVHENDVVENGDPLSDGPLDPHDILTAKGVVATQEFITNEILEIYRKQGVDINDKHIRVIVRQMMQKVKILDPGDTIFLEGEIVDKLLVKKINIEVEQEGGKVATFEQLLMGITKSALITDSFISAASFQNTTKVLTEATVYGKVDTLEGLKESVIIGHRIPAGTGSKYYRKMVKKTLDEELSLKKTVDKLLPETDFDIMNENLKNNIQEQEA